jgi:hypothetical protein
VILGIAVLSHWFLDFIVHFPDLPLSPGSLAKVGLGLWASLAGTMVVEFILFTLGIILYLRSRSSLNNKARIIFWITIALLILVEVSNFWGAPPTNVKALAWTAQFQWLFVILAYWMDRHTRIRILSSDG